MHLFVYLCRKQAKQIQEQLKEPQSGKNYSLKASSTMAKSESLVKNHVQLQSVSYLSTHLFPQPTSGLRGDGELGIRLVYIFFITLDFSLNHRAIVCVCAHAHIQDETEKLNLSFRLPSAI